MRFLTPLLALLASTSLAASLIPRTGGVETTCAQNAGVQACCTENQKLTPSANLLTSLGQQDPRLKPFLSALAPLVTLLAPIFAPISATVGVAQQCSSLGFLSVNPSVVSCGDAQTICCLNPKTANTNANPGGIINFNLLNGDILPNFCPNLNLVG